MVSKKAPTPTWNEKTVLVGSITVYDKNPRFIDQEGEDALDYSLKKYGEIDRLVVNKDKDLTLIGGHQRLNWHKKQGHKEVSVLMPSRRLTASEVKELNAILNIPRGRWDSAVLAGSFDLDEVLELGIPIEDLDLNAFGLGGDEEDHTGASSGGNGVVVKYVVIFDNAFQQERFHNWLRQLKDQFPATDTHAERIDLFLQELGVQIKEPA